MKKVFIIANWKSNKTQAEATDWLQQFIRIKDEGLSEERKVIICPPFTLLSEAKSLITNYKLPITLGAQDISPFEEGAYTGEINGRQIKELADYVIIGHSERRQNFQENDKVLSQKVAMAIKYQIIPTFCIQSQDNFIPGGVDIVVWEPVFAIGTGNPETPENADTVARFVKRRNKVNLILYGGSVSPKNVKSFTEMANIDGVLVGTESLEGNEFLQIIKNS